MNELAHDTNDRTRVHAYFKDICFGVTITSVVRRGSPENVAPYLNAQDVVAGVCSGCPRRQSIQTVLSFGEYRAIILLNSPDGFNVELSIYII